MVLDVLKVEGCEEVYLSTDPENFVGKHLYEKLGFENTGRMMDGKKAGGRNNFIINSGGVIRDDPFFYEVIEGSTDFEYIQDLFGLR